MLFVAAIFMPLTLFGQTVSGYFLTKPDSGGARNRMCIKSNTSNSLTAKIATAYCPAGNPECYGARLGEIEFESKLIGGHIHHIGNGRREINIKITADGAIVSQRPECMDAYLNLNSGGIYKLIRREVKNDDCEL